MHNPPRILVVDDNETNRDILVTRLGVHGYELLQAADGEEALAADQQHLPDLILLDIMMPKLDGIEVTKRIKGDKSMPFTPIILVTAKADSKDIVAGLEAGADEYLTKPVDQMSLVARVKSVLRIKELHDTVNDWNKTLEQRVSDQVSEIERVGRLKRFLAPQVAELLVVVRRGRHQEPPPRHQRGVLRPARLHRLRRDRGARGGDGRARRVSRLPRRADPQARGDVGQVRRRRADGAVQRSGAGAISRRCARSAWRSRCAMRSAQLAVKWRKYGHQLGFGMGIAHGYATIGQIGFEGRYDYSAIGSVVNLAARLCGEAQAGQILVDAKAFAAIEDLAEADEIGELTLKGFHRPVFAYNVKSLKG